MDWIYPFIMGCAVATGWVVSRRTQRAMGLTSGQRLGIGLGAFIGGMVGAKLPFLLADWEGFVSGRAWLESGKTIMIGLVGGYFGVEAAKWAMGIRVKTGDSFAAPVAAAIAVGRLACFCAPCCYGTVTDLPWGVNFGDGLYRHPTQLYEFCFHPLPQDLPQPRCPRGLRLLRRTLVRPHGIQPAQQGPGQDGRRVPTAAAPTTAACAPSTSNTPASAWSRSPHRAISNARCAML